MSKSLLKFFIRTFILGHPVFGTEKCIKIPSGSKLKLDVALEIMWNATTNAKQFICCPFCIRKRVKDLFYSCRLVNKIWLLYPFKWLTSRFPIFLPQEQIYKCYNYIKCLPMVDTMKPIMLTLQLIPPNNQKKIELSVFKWLRWPYIQISRFYENIVAFCKIHYCFCLRKI